MAELARALHTLVRDKAALDGFDAALERLAYQISVPLGPAAVATKSEQLLSLMHRSLRAPVVRQCVCM